MSLSGHRNEGSVRAWLIRGGRDGEREGRALSEGLAIAGWAEAGDLSRCRTWAELTAALQRTYPEAGRNLIGNWTGQLWKFTTEIQEGDLVVMPLKTNQGFLAVGRVAGPYEYRGDELEDFRQVRRVDWIRPDVPWSVIRPDLRASLGSLLTVCGLTRNDAARRIAHLAEQGNDPGIAGEEQATSAEELLEDAASRDPSNPRTLTIRSLLEHWGWERRTAPVISIIKKDLAAQGLTTRPPFTEGSVGDVVALVRLGAEPGTDTETEGDTADTEDVSEPDPMTLRLGRLPARLVSVPSTADLTFAKTLMVMRQFSQIAVIDEDGTYHGVVSWESIGRAHIASDDPSLESATASALVVDHDAPLLDQISVIYDRGFILVRDADRFRVTGILTASDLTRQFGTLARPFVLIEEAENRLRRAAEEVFTVDDLKDAVANHQKARVTRAADLTFGNYVYLLQNEDRWAKLGWKLDHDQFIELLTTVRNTRNELMHFTEDPLADEQYAAVEGLLELLRTADPRP
ncbi:CBS domain-containing protein [Actinomadura luteofluorescens]